MGIHRYVLALAVCGAALSRTAAPVPVATAPAAEHHAAPDQVAPDHAPRGSVGVTVPEVVLAVPVVRGGTVHFAVWVGATATGVVANVTVDGVPVEGCTHVALGTGVTRLACPASDRARLVVTTRAGRYPAT